VPRRPQATHSADFEVRVREWYGRVAIGHSELNGAQHWGLALEYGKKAGERAAVIGGFG